jgi:hypothetical protein
MKRKDVQAIIEQIQQNPLSTDEQKRAALSNLNALYHESNQPNSIIRNGKKLKEAVAIVATKLDVELRYIVARKSYVIEQHGYNWADKKSGWC